MSWVRIDDSFYDNPKVKRAGLAATGLYVMALSYCGRHLTDGHVPAEFVMAHGNKRVAERLEACQLFERNLTQGGWQIRDYLDFNFSREETLKRKAEVAQKRSEAGKRGADARWQNGKPDGKPDSNLPMAKNASRPDPNPTQPDSKMRDVSGGSEEIRTAILRSLEGGAEA